MSSSQERKIVRKKKKFGKIYEFTPVSRTLRPDDEMLANIETMIKKERLLTPQLIADKTGVAVSTARRILKEKAEAGDLKVLIKNKYTIVYVKA